MARESGESDSVRPFSIRAVELDDGRERWSYEFPAYDREAGGGSLALPWPAVAEGTVYVASGLYGDTGDVFALNTTDGSEKWSVGANSNLSAPTVVGNSVYIGTSGIALNDEGEEVNETDGELDAWGLYALDRSTGSERWSYEAGAMWSPTIVDGIVYAGYYNGFATLDSTSGEVLWEYETDSENVSSPIVTSDLIYITDGEEIKVFDRANQELLWSIKLDNTAASNPIVANQSVFVSTSDDVLYAVGETGAELTPTQSSSDEPADSSGGSGPTNPVAGPSSATEAVQTNSLAQQQGTAGGNQNVNDEAGGFPVWREFGSSSSTLGIGVLGSALGLGGIYATYRRFSRNDNSSNED